LALEIERLEALLDRLGTHTAAEVLTEPVTHLAVKHLVALEVLDLEVAEPIPHRVEPVDLGLRALTQLAHLALGRLLDLAAHVALGPFGLELGEVGFELLRASLDVGVTALFDLLALDVDLTLERGQVAVASLLVDPRDHVGGEVDDLLEVLRREVEQVPEPRRHALEVPDVRDRRGELDVPHALATHLGARDLDATALTDDALEPDPLVLAAVAFPVAGGAEDLLAEEPVLLRLEGSVIDGFRLLDLAVRPFADVVCGREADAQLVVEVDVEHVCPSLAKYLAVCRRCCDRSAAHATELAAG